MRFHLSIIFITVGSIFTILGAIFSFIESSKRDKELLEMTKENSEATKKNLDLISGGKTFAYLSNDYWSDIGILGDEINFVINIEGIYPIYDLNISLYEIVFVNVEESITDNGLTQNISEYNQFLLIDKSVGTLGKGVTREIFGKVKLNSNRNKNYFLVKFRARNGESLQKIIFRRRDDNLWDIATKVSKYEHTQNNAFEVKTLFEHKDKSFADEDLSYFFY